MRLHMRKLVVTHKPLYINSVIKMININSPGFSTAHSLIVIVIINLLTTSTVYRWGNSINTRHPHPSPAPSVTGKAFDCVRLKRPSVINLLYS